jgi:four helix bundle protein
MAELKDFGFKDQICRACASIPANISEGYERNTPREFIRFLNISKGSAGELKTYLYLAKEIGYLDQERYAEFLEETKEITAMLAGLIAYKRREGC